MSTHQASHTVTGLGRTLTHYADMCNHVLGGKEHFHIQIIKKAPLVLQMYPLRSAIMQPQELISIFPQTMKDIEKPFK